MANGGVGGENADLGSERGSDDADLGDGRENSVLGGKRGSEVGENADLGGGR